MAVVKALEEKFNPEHPAREVVYNDGNVRVMRFYLKGGQEIKPHRSPSTVVITVLKGKLSFYIGSEDREEVLEEGATVFYDPNEPHGFKALEDSIAQAVVAPNPTVRT